MKRGIKMSEYKKSAEFQALIEKYDWVALRVSDLESGKLNALRVWQYQQQLLGGLDLLYNLAQSGKTDDDHRMIGRIYSEVRKLYKGSGFVFSAPVEPGDTVYDICPPDDVVPAVICPCVVDDVSTRSVSIDGVAIPHEDIGRTVFKTRKEAERYIAETWGEQA